MPTDEVRVHDARTVYTVDRETGEILSIATNITQFHVPAEAGADVDILFVGYDTADDRRIPSLPMIGDGKPDKLKED